MGEEIFYCLQDKTKVDFSNTWRELLIEMNKIKQEIHAKCESNVLFNKSIDINNVSLSKLYDYMIVGDQEEILEVFFNNKDYSQEILSACEKTKKQIKLKH